MAKKKSAKKKSAKKTPVKKTPVKKTTVRRAWTSSDVRELKSLAKKKAGVARIAKALKRTAGAIAVKAHQLGVSLDTRG
jgi:aspartate oxidase